MANTPIQEQIIRLLKMSPALRVQFDEIAQVKANDWLSIQSPNVLDEYQESAIAAGVSYLSAALNSFRTLELLILDISTTPYTLKNFTTQGVSGLTRQIVEPLVWADWLISCTTGDELRTRGFAAVWENTSEALKYARAIESPDFLFRENYFQKIVDEGIALGFIPSGKNNPTTKLPYATDQFASKSLPTALVRGLDSIYGSQIGNAAWIYRWLSGVTHGQIWANTPTRNSQSTGIMTQFISLDWNRIGLSLVFAMELFKTTITKYQNPIKFP